MAWVRTTWYPATVPFHVGPVRASEITAGQKVPVGVAAE